MWAGGVPSVRQVDPGPPWLEESGGAEAAEGAAPHPRPSAERTWAEPGRVPEPGAAPRRPASAPLLGCAWKAGRGVCAPRERVREHPAPRARAPGGGGS